MIIESISSQTSNNFQLLTKTYPIKDIKISSSENINIKYPFNFILESNLFFEKIENIDDFIKSRNKSLEKCINEHKWYLSEKRNNDVGIEFAKDNFFNNYKGFDDGFIAAYLLIGKTDKNRSQDYHFNCNKYDFYKNQADSLKDFIQKYMIQMMFIRGKNVTYKESEREFINNYCKGWCAGFRAGYCGNVCIEKDNCDFGKKYL